MTEINKRFVIYDQNDDYGISKPYTKKKKKEKFKFKQTFTFE